MRQHQRAFACGIERVFDHQPLHERDLGVVVLPGALEIGRIQAWLGAQDLPRIQPLAGGQALVERQRVVQLHAGLQFGAVQDAAAGHRHQESQWMHEMWRHAQQDFAFAHVGAHQAEVEHFEIAQAAVDQARWARGRARGQVVLLHQGDFEPAQGQVAGDAGADDAAADHQHVERAAFEGLERTVALLSNAHCGPVSILKAYGSSCAAVNVNPSPPPST